VHLLDSGSNLWNDLLVQVVKEIVKIRVSHVLLLATVLSVLTSGCGGSSGTRGTTGLTWLRSSRTSSTRTTSAVEKATMAEVFREGAGHHYLKDRDREIGSTKEEEGYRDSDDARTLAYYAHGTSAATRRRVVAVTERYYALARAENTSDACAMLAPELQKAIVEDDGRMAAPYLRSAKTCEQVLSRLFRHNHRELTGSVGVTGVLVKGEMAYALLGSTKMPASFITLLYVHGRWRINMPLGGNVL
jgi:hypothetical protein